jgi:hypothetical protein
LNGDDDGVPDFVMMRRRVRPQPEETEPHANPDILAELLVEALTNYDKKSEFKRLDIVRQKTPPYYHFLHKDDPAIYVEPLAQPYDSAEGIEYDWRDCRIGVIDSESGHFIIVEVDSKRFELYPKEEIQRVMAARKSEANNLAAGPVSE